MVSRANGRDALAVVAPCVLNFLMDPQTDVRRSAPPLVRKARSKRRERTRHKMATPRGREPEVRCAIDHRRSLLARRERRAARSAQARRSSTIWPIARGRAHALTSRKNCHAHPTTPGDQAHAFIDGRGEGAPQARGIGSRPGTSASAHWF